MNTRVLNDYVLLDILDYMSIEQLLQLEIVSKQFMNCIGRVIRVRKQLSVGLSDDLEVVSTFSNFVCLRDPNYRLMNIRGFLRNAIQSAITRTDNLYDLSSSLDSFASMANKCNQIQCLTLKDCYLDDSVFTVIDYKLSKLQCLSMINCHFPHLV